MTADLTPTTPSPAPAPPSHEAHLRVIGGELVASLRDMVASMPQSDSSPTRLASRLGMSRVLVSRMLGAITCVDALESMQRIPGPESLRTAATGASKAGASQSTVVRCRVAIDAFAALIRRGYGTRGQLHAVIADLQPALRTPFEAAARAQIHRSMRDLLGIAADAWVATILIVPSTTRRDVLEIARIEGALGVERAGSFANIHVCTRRAAHPSAMPLDIDLRDGGPNHPAPRAAFTAGGVTVERLADAPGGHDGPVDMLAAWHDRLTFSTPGNVPNPLPRLTICPDIPVRSLLVDVLLHDGLSPRAGVRILGHARRHLDEALAAEPSRAREVADPNILMQELDAEEHSAPWREWPRQQALIERVAARLGCDAGRFRNHRVRITHPVPGFRLDVMIAFDRSSSPPLPETDGSSRGVA